MAPYAADIEQILVDWLVEQTEAARVGTKLPADLEAALADGAVVRLGTFGGADDVISIDTANVDIEVFTGPDGDGNPTTDVCHDFAEEIRELVRVQLPGHHTAEATILRTRTITRPTERDWDTSAICRYQAAYAVTFKTRTA